MKFLIYCLLFALMNGGGAIALVHQISDNSHTLPPHLIPHPAANQSVVTGERFVQKSDEKYRLEVKLETLSVGFGTYPLRGEACANAVEQAVREGYHVIDTATFYGNLEPIGKVLKKFGRQNFYVISKVWPHSQTARGLKKDLSQTLKKLQTDYLDAYLIHWPNRSIPIEETLYAMDELRSKGYIRHIGLSNVTVNHLKRVLELNVPITWVQIEMNPFFYDAELLTFCRGKGILVQAWAPLGRGRIEADPLLSRIGKKYHKSASQVAIKWIIQHGCMPLPGSKNKDHIHQNKEIDDFMLTKEEMKEIDERAQNGQRERITKEMGLGFEDEFDLSYEECWPMR